jgi:hypothetical protein
MFARWQLRGIDEQTAIGSEQVLVADRHLPDRLTVQPDRAAGIGRASGSRRNSQDRCSAKDARRWSRKPQASKRLAAVGAMMHANAPLFDDLFETVRASETMVVLQKDPAVTMVATETLTVEGANRAELSALKDQFGLQVVREGLFGKVLLRIKDEGGPEAVKMVFECANVVYRRGNVEAAHPNFIRLVDHTVRQAQAVAAVGATALPWWNHRPG